ncbi:MAG: hypothetical protein WA004_20185 [Saprospiraceae bacterium]
MEAQSPKYPEKWLYKLLQLAAVCVLLGRAYQHWFWDAPYRAILWDESLMKPLVEGLFGVSWREYAGNVGVDRAVQAGMKVIGSLLAAGAVVAAFPRRFPAKARWILAVLSGWLVLLAFLYYKEQNFQVGQFIEYALQAGAPLFFFLYMKKGGGLEPRLEAMMRWAAALTFVGHGLYAVGYYPRPGHFTVMVINSLGLPPDASNQLLWVAGILDFVAAALLALPLPGRTWALIYCVIWGFLTSIGRLTGNFHAEFFSSFLHQWLFEFVYRAPHFLLPLALVIHWFGRRQDGRLPVPRRVWEGFFRR